MPALGPKAQAEGFGLGAVAETGSTSADLFDHVAGGGAGPRWQVADAQTAGRGRRARGWSSPPGNLYASLLLDDPALPGRLPQLSFVLALALRDAVLAASGLADDPRLRIKWPNDLMVDGHKVAGLLLEGGNRRGTGFVVAGMGVNIVSHPQGTNHPAGHLLADGYRVDRDGLFAALSDAVCVRLAQWARGDSFAAIRADWLKTGYGIGGPIRVVTLTDDFQGRFVDLDADGHLIVQTDTGLRTVSAGDVFALSETGKDPDNEQA